MGKKELAIEIAKFFATGIVTFFASMLYTNYQVEPTLNVRLVPLSIEQRSSCEVKRPKLQEALKNFGLEDGPPTLVPTYESYLKALAKQRPRVKGRWMVDKDTVPEWLIDQFEREGIFTCSLRDEYGREDWRYHTVLVLQVAVLLDELASYVVKPPCFALYDGDKIPLRFSPRETTVMKLGYDYTNFEPSVLTIRQTGDFALQYDAREADNTNPRKFNLLVKNMSGGDIELSVECMVLNSSKEVHIGSQKPYRISTRVESQ